MAAERVGTRRRVSIMDDAWELWREVLLRELVKLDAKGEGLDFWWDDGTGSVTGLAPLFEHYDTALRTLTVRGAIHELRAKTPLGEALSCMALGVFLPYLFSDLLGENHE